MRAQLAAAAAGALLSAVIVRAYYRRLLKAELARIKAEATPATPPRAAVLEGETSSSSSASSPSLPPRLEIATHGLDGTAVMPLPKCSDRTSVHAEIAPCMAPGVPSAPSISQATALEVDVEGASSEGTIANTAQPSSKAPMSDRAMMDHDTAAMTQQRPRHSRDAAMSSTIAEIAGVPDGLGGGRKNPSLLALDALGSLDERDGGGRIGGSFVADGSVPRPRAALYGKLGSQAPSRLASRVGSRDSSTNASFIRCKGTNSSFDSTCGGVSKGDSRSEPLPADGLSGSNAPRSVLRIVAEDDGACVPPSQRPSGPLEAGRRCDHLSPVAFRPAPPLPPPSDACCRADAADGDAGDDQVRPMGHDGDDSSLASSHGGVSEDDETSFTQVSPKSQGRYSLLSDEERRLGHAALKES